jgi:two-component system response regulator HydG
MNETSLLPGARQILVVEDDAEVLQAIAQMLNHLGNGVTECGRAEDAFGLVQAEQFDLLLIDYRMPEMTGLDLIVMLRQEGCNVPVIMMTGYPATEERVASQSLGVFAILKKPVTPEQLAGATAEIFNKATVES